MAEIDKYVRGGRRGGGRAVVGRGWGVEWRTQRRGFCL